MIKLYGSILVHDEIDEMDEEEEEYESENENKNFDNWIVFQLLYFNIPKKLQIFLNILLKSISVL